VLQIAAGVVFTTPEIVGPIAGFVLLGGIALWIVAIILRTVASPTQLQAVHA
jgi:membrane protein implicated in regulation of membrane protease activity